MKGLKDSVSSRMNFSKLYNLEMVLQFTIYKSTQNVHNCTIQCTLLLHSNTSESLRIYKAGALELE